MSPRGEELYGLLPAVYRIRDAERGGPLRALLEVIGEQVEVLDENLAQLYDDQFIETCADWVVPYIGDLVGARGLYGLTQSTYSRRAQVANTLAYRRRKGTAAVIEELARDVTGWPARVVEFFRVLATTQHLNHLRPDNRYSPDLRAWEPSERTNTPFDTLAHTADVRRIESNRGRYNVTNVGLFLWRLRAYPLTGSTAFKVDDRRYLFSPLGNDAPLYTRPDAEDDTTHIAEPDNAPMPLSRRALHEYPDKYYGSNKSLRIEVDGQEVPREAIVACDLSDAGGDSWAHRPGSGQYAVDPVLGRIALPGAPTSSAPVRVSYHHGFSADMGGGEYDRAGSFDPGLPEVVASRAREVREALTDGGAGDRAVVIRDSESYSWGEVSGDSGTQTIHAGQRRVGLRADDGRRPVLKLDGPLTIDGDRQAEVTLDGLLITGGQLRLIGNLGALRLRHCTLVPGLALDRKGNPTQPSAPSLVVETNEQAGTLVEIDHCIVGGVRVRHCSRVRITDSVLDATTGMAYDAPDTSVPPNNPLRVENSTIIGRVRTTLLESASNSIFTGDVSSERVQAGSVRFSYLPPDSRTPRRYRCQPSAESETVRPRFTSLRYAAPGYCQLRAGSAAEIREGADDGGEMGAFHDLYQARRETNLRVRLDEYVRFGLEVGIFYAS